MSKEDLVAPIGYYDRMVWLFGIIILTYLVFIAQIENRTVEVFFFMAIPFSFGWWHKVRDPERPPIEFLVARIALGFLMGLGLIALLLRFFTSLGRVSVLWGVPALDPTILATTGASMVILTQFGVGIVEEGIFRVAIPRLAMARGINPFAIIIASNWTFALFHWVAYGGNVGSIIIAFFAGILQSIAYSTSGSAIGVMLGHAFWNIAIAGYLFGFLYYVALGLVILGIVYYLKLKTWSWTV